MLKICSEHFHVHCLAERCLRGKAEFDKHIFPIDGNCPKCEVSFFWVCFLILNMQFFNWWHIDCKPIIHHHFFIKFEFLLINWKSKQLSSSSNENCVPRSPIGDSGEKFLRLYHFYVFWGNFVLVESLAFPFPCLIFFAINLRNIFWIQAWFYCTWPVGFMGVLC